MEEVEKRYILRVLEAVGGNKTLAAQVLGLDRKTLYRKLDRYGFGAQLWSGVTGNEQRASPCNRPISPRDGAKIPSPLGALPEFRATSRWHVSC
jgi:hypothetical protein